MAENTPETAKATWASAYKQVEKARAFTEGWNAGQVFTRKQVTDLLERSGKERAELEARVEQLEEDVRSALNCLNQSCLNHSPVLLLAAKRQLIGALSGEHPKEEGDD